MSTTKNVIDVDLSLTDRTPVRFSKDDSRVVLLNLSDMNILRRIEETYPKLHNLQIEASKIAEGTTTDSDDSDEVMANIHLMSGRLQEVDRKMRDLIDFMFDAPVSAAAVPSGSMYDPFAGSFRYEYLITVLMEQYSKEFKSEFSKMEKRMKEHTTKYTGK